MSTSTLTITVREPLTNSNTITLENVFVDSFNTEVILADDGITPIGNSYAISGTVTLDITADYANFFSALEAGSNRCVSVQIQVGGVTLASLSDDADDKGGPYCKLSTTQVVGHKTALMQFSITAQQSYVGDQTVVSHRWNQKISIDAAGRLTHHVSGSLTVARGTSGSTNSIATKTTWEGKIAYADLFRRAIIPPVPGVGWRRESQEFALDDAGTMLVYSFTDKRFAYDLPNNVIAGDMSFTYERSLENPAQAMCTFSCDLEGDLGLKSLAGTTPNRRLVEIAVALSKTRIDLNYERTIVQRMRVTEKDMLSGYAIRFELDAVVMPREAYDSTVITAIAYMVGNAFTITRTDSRSVDAYGPYVSEGESATTYGMIPHWVANAVSGMEPTTGDMPQAALFTITGANTYGAVEVAVISGADGVEAMNAAFNGAYQGSQIQQGEQSINGETGPFQTLVQHTVSITHCTYDSGIVRLSPMYVSAPDFVFQTRKPTPIIEERVEVSRMNHAPAKFLRPLPSNAYLIDDDWKVSFGKYDAQGNRLFSGIYTRRYAMYDGGSGVAKAISGYSTETAPSGAQLRVWGALDDIVRPSYSPLGGDQESGSVFIATGADVDAQYGVAQQDYVT